MRFVVANRMLAPRFWVFALRYVWVLKIRNRRVATRGFAFLGRCVEVTCGRLGRMEIGRWVWIGTGSRVRCHEGFLRVGDKSVVGADVTINAYLDVDIGADCLVGDDVYVADFDHRFDDLSRPIRKQGLITSPVRVEADCWIGEKASILRGVTVGRGSVVGAHAVVNRDVPPYSVAVGNPVRVVGRRGERRDRDA